MTVLSQPLKNKQIHVYKQVAVKDCFLLERNPQYLTPKQMQSLKKSIEKDGFVVPILVRPNKKGFEIISGNHRFMAAQELGYENIPAVVAKLSDNQAKKLAINLNLIHGDPLAEQLAPFLAQMDDDVLKDIHLDGPLLDDVLNFDAELEKKLGFFEVPEAMNRESPKSEIGVCKCPNCGKKHIKS